MLLTYQEFFNKYNGKPVEVAGSANAINQCVDLANAYIREVLGLPIVEWTNAIDFPKKCLPPNYEYILNTPTGTPIQGDIMIWKSPDGIGHIAVFDKSIDLNKFISFDQNWPVGSVCKLVTHTYTGTYTVVGWLRGKKQVTESITDEQKKILEFIGAKTEGDVRAAFGALADSPDKDKQIQTLQARVLSLETDQKNLADRITALESNIQADLKLITDWQSKVETANKKIEELIKTNEELTADRNTIKGRYESKCEELRKLDKMTAWGHIRYGINLLVSKSK